MKRALLLAVVVLALGGSEVQARSLLTGPDARVALVRWSLNHNMTEAEPGPCLRLARDRLRCELTETGWWGDPAEGLRADHVVSWYRVTRRPDGIAVSWIDFAYGPPY